MSEAKRQLMPGRLEATRSQVAIANRRPIAWREWWNTSGNGRFAGGRSAKMKK